MTLCDYVCRSLSTLLAIPPVNFCVILDCHFTELNHTKVLALYMVQPQDNLGYFDFGNIGKDYNLVGSRPRPQHPHNSSIPGFRIRDKHGVRTNNFNLYLYVYQQFIHSCVLLRTLYCQIVQI